MTFTVGTAGPLALYLRVPGWAGGAALAVNGEAQTAPTPGTYARVERDWAEGGTLTLTLPLLVRREVGHPRATSQRGQAALGRGPLVYCFEAADNPDTDIRDIRLPAAPEFVPDLLNGVTVLHGSAPAPVTAIPYYAWANREPGLMAVWSASES